MLHHSMAQKLCVLFLTASVCDFCLQGLQVSKHQLEKDLRSMRQERNALLATLRNCDHTSKSALSASHEFVSERETHRHAPSCSKPVRKPLNEFNHQQPVSQHSSVAGTPLKDCFPASNAGLPQEGLAVLQHESDCGARGSNDENCPMSSPSVTPHSNPSLATGMVSVGEQRPSPRVGSAELAGPLNEPELQDAMLSRLQQLQQLAESLLT